MFEIIWDKNAQNQVNKLEPIISIRIIKKVNELSEDPFSRDVKRLKGTNLYRLRVGDYRVFFEIEQNRISILKIGHRKNIYNE